MKKKDYLLLKKMHKRLWEKKLNNKREYYLYQKQPEIRALHRRYLLLVARIHGMPAPANHVKQFKKVIQKSDWILESGDYAGAFEEFKKAIQIMDHMVPNSVSAASDEPMS